MNIERRIPLFEINNNLSDALRKLGKIYAPNIMEKQLDRFVQKCVLKIHQTIEEIEED